MASLSVADREFFLFYRASYVFRGAGVAVRKSFQGQASEMNTSFISILICTRSVEIKENISQKGILGICAACDSLEINYK